jgi:[ribosomal protein S5]-alanine N-acetyltransferase
MEVPAAMIEPRKLAPVLETERLILRPFTEDDADRVTLLCGDRAIASTTLNIAHPYERRMAVEWIRTHGPSFSAEISVTYAVVRREDNLLVGAMGLGLQRPHGRAELGYWIGVPYWGQGYATEAARRVVQYAFEDLGLHKVYATHLARNPASGRVMRKIGMQQEGVQRQHVLKWDVYEDLVNYGILAGEG